MPKPTFFVSGCFYKRSLAPEILWSLKSGRGFLFFTDLFPFFTGKTFPSPTNAERIADIKKTAELETAAPQHLITH
jgi:hypothetical protein